MANELIYKYEQQLPKTNRIKFWVVLSNFSALVTIIGTAITFYAKSITMQEIIYTLYLCILLTLSFIYIIFRESKKQHRYSESVYFIAHSTQLVKDYLREYKHGTVTERDFSTLLDKIVNNVSKCFTLLKGKKCNVCIKTIINNNELECCARDSNSEVRYSENINNKIKHTIDKNTDFSSICDEKTGSLRYFLCNDIMKKWQIGEYENSSFEIVGMPKRKINKLNISSIAEWTLDYNSTLVCPIRHISAKDYPNKNYKHLWGFLCVDSHSSDIFDKNIDPELLYCFSNLIYMLISTMSEVNELNEYIKELWQENSALSKMTK
jgi:hypothetical protein